MISLWLGDGGAGSGELDGFVFGHGGGDRVHGAGIDQRFVALHVDVDVRGQVGRDFGDAVGTSTVVVAGEDGFGAEVLDGCLDPSSSVATTIREGSLAMRTRSTTC